MGSGALQTLWCCKAPRWPSRPSQAERGRANNGEGSAPSPQDQARPASKEDSSFTGLLSNNPDLSRAHCLPVPSCHRISPRERQFHQARCSSTISI